LALSLSAVFVDLRQRRDLLWEHTRNSLAVARLLVQERRPEAFVATTCQLAVETACRAALDHAGLRFDGDVGVALASLAAPGSLWDGHSARSAGAWLADAERAVDWVACYLRGEDPSRSWSY